MSKAQDPLSITPQSTLADLLALVEELSALANQGFKGDVAALNEYHRRMFALHSSRDPATYAQRYLVTTQLYPVEEQYIERVEVAEKMGWEEFVEAAKEAASSKSRIGHPMAQHLFAGEPTLQDVRVYMRHHWHRTKDFYQRLAEFAVRLEIEDASLLYKNVAEEVGVEGDEQSHPHMLQELLSYLDVPCAFSNEPTEPEAHAYMNNWFRCVRSSDVSWGLGFVFAVEWGVPAVHERIVGLLDKTGVPKEYQQFHVLHSSLDLEHSDEILQVSNRLLETAEMQGTFLSTLKLRRKLGSAYFDMIWREMQAGHQKAT